jgi:signal transduction histidine kinase/CheY-like chemotaxis protein
MRILNITLQHEHDVVLARQRARQIAALLGCEARDQTRIATAVSEIARNAVSYAGGGKVEFFVEGNTPPQLLQVCVSDQGPGIAALQTVLDGQYHSKTGMGLGIVGARRLMDQFDIASTPGHGTTVWLKKLLPGHAPLLTAPRLTKLIDELTRQRPHDPMVEIQQQNQELLQTLADLRQRQEELARANHELEDTNRGVVALYAELDEKADYLRRADELKTRFLSNMSHEFRTPVNSIVALSRLLLDGVDGALSPEQVKQVTFIRKAADTLAELVSDLLDLAKIEAGKITVRPAEFDVRDLFSALRGMLRPLLVSDTVNLIFEEPAGIPVLSTDEGKVSQILRNFISNALKFTERGEIRVSAALTPDGEAVIFSVADTGVGIAPEDQDTIFLEFTQLENPLQKKVKGTGLGLPLCKRLAELLGGRVLVTSTVGAGSTFSAVIPVAYHSPTVPTAELLAEWEPDPSRIPVLVVEDHAETQFIYEKFLQGSRFQAFPVRTIRDAQEVLQRVRPQAILLDILLPGKDAWGFLGALKGEDATKDIPTLVVTTVEDQRKGFALGADAYAIKPLERSWLLAELTRLTGHAPVPRVLIIDDEEIARYVLVQCLAGTPYLVSEAATGLEGLRRAREEHPQVIFLDLRMPGVDGYAVLEQLKADPVTRGIPVVISTSKALTPPERAELATQAAALLAKDTLSRETVTAALTAVLSAQSPPVREE